jgi:hypothetical protein
MVSRVRFFRPSRQFGNRMFLVHQPIEPILAEQLNRMLSPDGSISTAEILCRAVLVTPPADALRMLRMHRKIAHTLAAFCASGCGDFIPLSPDHPHNLTLQKAEG